MPPIPDRHQLHHEVPLSDAPPAAYAELAGAACDGRLVLYVGAGISVPTPALLPTSEELLQMLAPVVEAEFGIHALEEADGDADGDGDGEADDEAGPDPQATLESLADQAEEAGVLAAFRDRAASITGFRDAPPTYGHRAAAALLREGSVSVFSVNWDRCIEKGAAKVGFHIDPTITEDDRAVRFASCRFHKIHGCATQPSSLLITTNELKTPPAWVEHVVGAALGANTLVFVGLGTVGGYVRTRVAQVLTAIGDDAAVWLADPYPSRAWEELLERASDHILEIDANNFFDDLVRACVRHALVQLQAASRDIDATGWNPPLAPATVRLVDALSKHHALEVIGWLRAGAGGVSDGSPFLHSRDACDALLTAAAVTGNAPFQARGDHEHLVLMAGDAAIELAVWPGERADVMVARETARVVERHERHCYDDLAPTIFHICAGHRGILPLPDLPGDIGGGGDEFDGDLLESEPRHRWVPARSVLEGMLHIEVPA